MKTKRSWHVREDKDAAAYVIVLEFDTPLGMHRVGAWVEKASFDRSMFKLASLREAVAAMTYEAEMALQLHIADMQPPTQTKH